MGGGGGVKSFSCKTQKIGFKIPRILLTVDLLHSIHIPMVLRPPTVQMIFFTAVMLY